MLKTCSILAGPPTPLISMEISRRGGKIRQVKSSSRYYLSTTLLHLLSSAKEAERPPCSSQLSSSSSLSPALSYQVNFLSFICILYYSALNFWTQFAFYRKFFTHIFFCRLIIFFISWYLYLFVALVLFLCRRLPFSLFISFTYMHRPFETILFLMKILSIIFCLFVF